VSAIKSPCSLPTISVYEEALFSGSSVQNRGKFGAEQPSALSRGQGSLV